jgi:biotin carboxyl carrier protein
MKHDNRWPVVAAALAAIAGPGCLGNEPCVPDAAEGAVPGGAIAQYRPPEPGHAPPEPAPGPLAILGVAPSRPALTTDDRQHLLFELVVQNTSATGVELARIDVRDPERRAPLASYTGAQVPEILAIATGAGATPASLAPGGVAVAYFDLAFARRAELPHRLVARFALRQGDTAIVEAGPSVAVIDDHPHPIGPPLHLDRLVAVNGCCDGIHRRALIEVDGGLFLAERFAIDFLRIDDRGTFSGDPTRNDSYFVFGADVLAVAAGTIAETSDGAAENVPTQPLPPPDIATAAGNHVVLALDDGRFALYAHLQTGSVRVHPGDRVRRGDVLGLVGNTGNSTEPHLHFHVMDRPSPLVSDGLPYTFDRFDLQARIDVSSGTAVIAPAPPPERRRDRLPLGLDVIDLR